MFSSFVRHNFQIHKYNYEELKVKLRTSLSLYKCPILNNFFESIRVFRLELSFRKDLDYLFLVVLYGNKNCNNMELYILL